ncbi:MAG TPA: glycosyltransferase family 1 protein [Anaerolineales bacterium]|nr:glycosyltransferase family 1 protein [Anaerolineales bacterium]
MTQKTHLRVGIDATALPPQPVGAGNYMIQLIRALAKLDSDLELVIFAHPHGKALIDVPEQAGLHWSLVPDQKPALRLVWEQTRFPGLIRQEGIDLLHSLHYTRPLRLPCTSVVTFHDMTFFLFPELHTRAKRLFFPAAIRYSARTADAVIAISESTRQDAIRLLKIDPARIQTIPLGVTGEFKPISASPQLSIIRQKYNLPECFILYVGLLEPRKNLPLLLRAYRQVLDRGPAPVLVLAGRMGWTVDTLRHTIDDLALTDQIHFTGYVTPDDLPFVYNLADLFVYPSLYEGFGLPPLEALACGTPVITSSVSSIPANMGDAAILVQPDDQNALSTAIREILDNPELRQELIVKGPIQASKFKWETTARQTLAVYQQVLQNK